MRMRSWSGFGVGVGTEVGWRVEGSGVNSGTRMAFIFMRDGEEREDTLHDLFFNYNRWNALHGSFCVENGSLMGGSS